MKFTCKDLVWLVICIVVVLYSSIRTNELSRQLDNLQVFTLSVQSIDQQTGRPIDEIRVGAHPNVNPGQMMRLVSLAAPSPGIVSLEYIGTAPFAGTVSMTNAGYQQKVVSFDATNNNLLVPVLRKP